MSEPTPVYPFLAIDVPAIAAEVAAEQLFALGAEGVERRDATTLARGAGATGAPIDPGADIVESQAVWDAPPAAIADDELVTLVAAFSSREAAEEAMAEFGDDLNPRIEEVVGDGWRDAWKEHFAPFRISPRVVIEPPWRKADAALVDEVAGTQVLTLEPGRAFGTGLHPTTALLARWLDDHADAFAGRPLLDLGCGSGILSLVALLLGAGDARATDLDRDAVRITLENAAAAGLAERVQADDASFAALREAGRRWPLVLANIQAEVLVPFAEDIAALVEPGGLLALSGILVTQRDRVRAAYPSLALVEAPESGEWVALILRAP